MPGKNEIAEIVRREHGMKLKEARAVVDTVFDVVVEMALMADETVQVRGFGTFQARQHAARRFNNPHTGIGKMLPARKVLHFRVSPALKDEV